VESATDDKGIILSTLEKQALNTTYFLKKGKVAGDFAYVML
jgi:hypothetical protein